MPGSSLSIFSRTRAGFRRVWSLHPNSGYYPPPVEGLVIGISQSGETADTLTALKQAKAHNCRTLAITNVLGNCISRIADSTMFMRAGPESAWLQPSHLSPKLAVLMQLINSLCDRKYDDILLHAHQAIEEVLLLDLTEAVAACKNARISSMWVAARFMQCRLRGPSR